MARFGVCPHMIRGVRGLAFLRGKQCIFFPTTKERSHTTLRRSVALGLHTTRRRLCGGVFSLQANSSLKTRVTISTSYKSSPLMKLTVVCGSPLGGSFPLRAGEVSPGHGTK